MKTNVSQQFHISITPELSNILELIKTGNYYIYYLMDTSDAIHSIRSAYFFKKTCVTIDNHPCVSCIASICASDNNDSGLFLQGFMLSLFAIKPKYDYLLMEEISHNKRILKMSGVPTFSSPTAYFFYNFAYGVFNPEKVFILGT
jgi:hypothetical protein